MKKRQFVIELFDECYPGSTSGDDSEQFQFKNQGASTRQVIL